LIGFFGGFRELGENKTESPGGDHGAFSRPSQETGAKKIQDLIRQEFFERDAYNLNFLYRKRPLPDLSQTESDSCSISSTD